MSESLDEITRLEVAYRRAKRTIFGHLIFVGLACLVGVVIRRAVGLPQIFLATVFIVALVLFGGDIMKLLYCRNELRRLRGPHSTS